VRLSALALALLPLVSCSTATRPAFDKLTKEFVEGSLALSPVGATQAGYHVHKGVNLDESLDDFSDRGIEAQRQFYVDFHARFGALDAATLTAEQRADLEIMTDQISLGLLELDAIQNYRHNPTVYVELVSCPSGS
jgi:uncharacterized protein (DUF885 family)